MNYKETTAWMFSRLPMYQQQGASAYKKDLTNTLLLAQHLGNPERKIKTIHIAGTNGKGSVSNMLASVLQQAGYKTGLYTSPHLKDFRERIKINGQDIPEDHVCRFINNNKSFFEVQQLSFFEMTVGLAFDYFAQEQVDIAVIETGMGGRLDSTNIITPLVSVITNIGLDHTQFLGTTEAEIAGEKAGIIKDNIPVVIGEYTTETKPVFEKAAHEHNAPIYFAQDEVRELYPSDLTGVYQVQNQKTVLQTIAVLQKHFEIPEEAIKKGLLTVTANTGFMGRWQQINTSPVAVCDTAHNPHGLAMVMKQVLQQKFDVLRIVFGVVNDKDLSNILPLLPKEARYYFCKPDVPRGLHAEILQGEANAFGLQGKLYPSVADAYQAALSDSGKNDFIYIGGSTFVVAEIL
ncbi:bifunctional folylpolyglutamate synthase/dihydrofolate synthase [Flavobacterium salilacus subsp. salilacus]|uniref:bifunctional folylpolyglutamate synthase/dihydrofolate synthase n=1 Tax=Flavobacterium TaxID=237 RepID=UPI001074F5FA|nr:MULTISPECIES: folylpolyglutamate synthase/dihydrofolate synthase family protein [Flavobacterium]KAF2519635.1 bifunctional folylpolyglutamate synthase/dihydrofolate synthase [Flavobacterium salilacus subsp. salilacus]MBE1614463.1 bifunctional folylpolyglutamate synthase/dihydrofolate synthase [Flavobacterium sp. SaA2.13]